MFLHKWLRQYAGGILNGGESFETVKKKILKF